MTLFEFTDYRAYLKSHIRSLPKLGRGFLSKIAEHLSVNTTLISQIMAGSRDLSLEQAHELSLFLGHTDLETEYFSLLVHQERAGSQKFKQHLKKKLAHLKEESLKLSKRIHHEKKLTDHERAIFYSSWIYSVVHIFTSLKDEGVTLEEIAARFQLSRTKAAEVIYFLSNSGVIQEKEGRFHLGIQSTFLEQGSPHLLKHHSSWRIKAIEKSEKLKSSEMMLTGQFSISKKDFASVREKLTELVKNISSTVKDTTPEDIVCLNIDWFWLD